MSTRKKARYLRCVYKVSNHAVLSHLTIIRLRSDNYYEILTIKTLNINACKEKICL